MTIDEQIHYISSNIVNHNSKKIVLIVPESAGDILLSTSLFEDLKASYSEFDFYFACKPQFQGILKNNPYILKILDYCPIMENQVIMEGTGEWSGLFDISIMLTVNTQRLINYLNNGMTRISLDLKK